MSEQVLVIGAGPFGLSIAAHLRARGVRHLLVGKEMDTWLHHMPSGMKLRSEPYGSDICAPRGHHDLETFSALHGLDYQARLGPLSIERFRDYSRWFAAELAAEAVDRTVTRIERDAEGFRVGFAEGDDTHAAQVVVATGVLPFRSIPGPLAGLPPEVVSHTSDHHDLTVFTGKRVAVVGGGQSALETAALLRENGADPVVIARRSSINWLAPNPERLGPLGRVRRPVNKLCEGWHCAFWNSPSAFRRLPAGLRARKARSVLGPAGAWWLKDRVAGVVPTHTSHEVVRGQVKGSGVHLELSGPTLSSLDVDHVIAGTGFDIRLARLGFLDHDLQRAIATFTGYPVLSRAGESSVPGLYFAGAPAAVSLGPSVRFIAGTHQSVARLTNAIAASPGRLPERAQRPQVDVEGSVGSGL